MTLALAVTVGALFAFGTFLLLRDDLVKVVWGLFLYTQGANLFLIAMGAIQEGTADTVPILAGSEASPPDTGDPFVQALVLTAIVINFGITAFALALSYRAYQENGTLDVTAWAMSEDGTGGNDPADPEADAQDDPEADTPDDAEPDEVVDSQEDDPQ